MPRTRKRHLLMSPQAFAEYGNRAVAYMRQMRSEEAEFLYPQAPPLVPGLTVFVLHAADGTPALHHRRFRRGHARPARRAVAAGERALALRATASLQARAS